LTGVEWAIVDRQHPIGINTEDSCNHASTSEPKA
jgi:hypothetical protein